MIPLAAAAPWILTAVGGALPYVISALAGAKTPAEARAAIEPQREALIGQAIGRGMRRDEAETQADAALSGALQEEMSKGAIPGWAELGLGLIGGGAGALAGKAIKGARGMKLKKLDAAPKADPLAALDKRPGDPAPKLPKTTEMEPRRTPGPMDKGIDDGSEALMQDAPQTGLSAPFRKFDADIKPASAGRANRPERAVQDAEFEVVPPRRNLPGPAEERGFMMRDKDYAHGGVSPMSDDELELLEAIAASRKLPRRPPGMQAPFRIAEDPTRVASELRASDLAGLRERMSRY